MDQYLLHNLGGDKSSESLLFKTFKAFKRFKRLMRNLNVLPGAREKLCAQFFNRKAGVDRGLSTGIFVSRIGITLWVRGAVRRDRLNPIVRPLLIRLTSRRR